MNPQKISSMIEYNTAEFFMNLGHLNKDEVLDKPEIKYIFSKNWQSRIFMANFNELEAPQNIMQIISRLKELKISALWFISPMSRPENLENILEDHGFTFQNSWKAMAIHLKTAPEQFDIPDGMEIKEVQNLEELKIWTDVLVKSFEFPIVESYKKYFINAGVENIDFNYYLGFFNGEPVATSIYFKGTTAAGLFYIGTIPKARGKGIAETMVKYLLNRAKNEDYEFCVLQASELGYPVYKRIGFKEYFDTNIYNWKTAY